MRVWNEERHNQTAEKLGGLHEPNQAAPPDGNETEQTPQQKDLETISRLAAMPP